jgi:hypothetical protein
MKSYLLAHWQIIATAVMVIVLGATYGCAALQTRPDLAKVGVTLAVAKFVQDSSDPAARAEKVRGIATQLLAVTDNAESTVALLKAEAIRRLPVTMLPVDRAIAVALIDAVAAELELRVKDRLLPAERMLAIRTVLQWVIEGAGYGITPGTPAAPAE